jgi:hypothetical protein
MNLDRILHKLHNRRSISHVDFKTTLSILYIAGDYIVEFAPRQFKRVQIDQLVQEMARFDPRGWIVLDEPPGPRAPRVRYDTPRPAQKKFKFSELEMDL